MEKQVRVQVIGVLERNVVAGQFEDPDDDVMPNRMRRATAKGDNATIAFPQKSPPVPPPTPSPPPTSFPISVSTAPAPAIAAATASTGTAKSQLPVLSIPHPGMIPAMMQMPVTWVPVPMMPHPMHPAAAAWQHQACVMTHMFSMMNPIMQQMQQQPPKCTMTLPLPPTLNHGQIAHQQQSQEHRPLPPQPSPKGSIQTASTLPVEVIKEWRIPCSHNYYPTPGFFRDPAATDATATTATTTMKSKPKSRSCSKGAKMIMSSLDDIFIEGSDFPRIKEDTEKQFGLKAREINAVDVLCGRGGVTNYHEGNIQFRNLANQYRWHYATATKSRKARVARFLVQKIRDQQGRFLKKEADDSWYEIGDELALVKAAQTLREGLTKNYREELKAQMVIDHSSGSSKSYQPMRRLPSHQRMAKASHQRH